MNQELPTINGELLRLRRETRGWALSDLATRACMSIKQIRQLEEGGSSAFYSETVKWTSAKKVGSLLGMQPEEVFVQIATEVALPSQADVSGADVSTDAENSAVEPVVASVSSPQDELVAVATNASVEATASLETSQPSKTPVLALAALFVAALAVAAWMRPEPEVAVEPAPPVMQNMAIDANDAASPASAATAHVAASATAPMTAVSTAASSSASSAAAAGSTAASAARVAKPAASAASTTAVPKAANAVQAPASAASAASKPL